MAKDHCKRLNGKHISFVHENSVKTADDSTAGQGLDTKNPRATGKFEPIISTRWSDIKLHIRGEIRRSFIKLRSCSA